MEGEEALQLAEEEEFEKKNNPTIDLGIRIERGHPYEDVTVPIDIAILSERGTKVDTFRGKRGNPVFGIRSRPEDGEESLGQSLGICNINLSDFPPVCAGLLIATGGGPELRAKYREPILPFELQVYAEEGSGGFLRFHVMARLDGGRVALILRHGHSWVIGDLPRMQVPPGPGWGNWPGAGVGWLERCARAMKTVAHLGIATPQALKPPSRSVNNVSAGDDNQSLRLHADLEAARIELTETKESLALAKSTMQQQENMQKEEALYAKGAVDAARSELINKNEMLAEELRELHDKLGITEIATNREQSYFLTEEAAQKNYFQAEIVAKEQEIADAKRMRADVGRELDGQVQSLEGDLETQLAKTKQLQSQLDALESEQETRQESQQHLRNELAEARKDVEEADKDHADTRFNLESHRQSLESELKAEMEKSKQLQVHLDATKRDQVGHKEMQERLRAELLASQRETENEKELQLQSEAVQRERDAFEEKYENSSKKYAELQKLITERKGVEEHLKQQLAEESAKVGNAQKLLTESTVAEKSATEKLSQIEKERKDAEQHLTQAIGLQEKRIAEERILQEETLATERASVRNSVMQSMTEKHAAERKAVEEEMTTKLEVERQKVEASEKKEREAKEALDDLAKARMQAEETFTNALKVECSELKQKCEEVEHFEQQKNEERLVAQHQETHLVAQHLEELTQLREAVEQLRERADSSVTEKAKLEAGQKELGIELQMQMEENAEMKAAAQETRQKEPKLSEEKQDAFERRIKLLEEEHIAKDDKVRTHETQLEQLEHVKETLVNELQLQVKEDHEMKADAEKARQEEYMEREKREAALESRVKELEAEHIAKAKNKKLRNHEAELAKHKESRDMQPVKEENKEALATETQLRAKEEAEAIAAKEETTQKEIKGGEENESELESRVMALEAEHATKDKQLRTHEAEFGEHTGALHEQLKQLQMQVNEMNAAIEKTSRGREGTEMELESRVRALEAEHIAKDAQLRDHESEHAKLSEALRKQPGEEQMKDSLATNLPLQTKEDAITNAARESSLESRITQLEMENIARDEKLRESETEYATLLEALQIQLGADEVVETESQNQHEEISHHGPKRLSLWSEAILPLKRKEEAETHEAFPVVDLEHLQQKMVSPRKDEILPKAKVGTIDLLESQFPSASSQTSLASEFQRFGQESYPEKLSGSSERIWSGRTQSMIDPNIKRGKDCDSSFLARLRGSPDDGRGLMELDGDCILKTWVGKQNLNMNEAPLLGPYRQDHAREDTKQLHGEQSETSQGRDAVRIDQPQPGTIQLVKKNAVDSFSHTAVGNMSSFSRAQIEGNHLPPQFGIPTPRGLESPPLASSGSSNSNSNIVWGSAPWTAAAATVIAPQVSELWHSRVAPGGVPGLKDAKPHNQVFGAAWLGQQIGDGDIAGGGSTSHSLSNSPRLDVAQSLVNRFNGVADSHTNSPALGSQLLRPKPRWLLEPPRPMG